jgi:hypothetical protein
MQVLEIQALSPNKADMGARSLGQDTIRNRRMAARSHGKLQSFAVPLQINPTGCLRRKTILITNFARKRTKARRRCWVGTPVTLI